MRLHFVEKRGLPLHVHTSLAATCNDFGIKKRLLLPPYKDRRGHPSVATLDKELTTRFYPSTSLKMGNRMQSLAG